MDKLQGLLVLPGWISLVSLAVVCVVYYLSTRDD